MLAPPEIETPLPSVLGGEKGERGETNPQGRHCDDIAATLKGYRALRFQAHATGRAVLTREALRMRAVSETTAPHLGDVFRTIDCMTKRRQYFVELHHHRQHNAASFGGLVTCGSVWACPLCAAKIQERRRTEIEKGIEAMRSRGLVPIMVTLTFPHRSWHSLSDLITQQAEAFARLRAGSPWKRLMGSIGFAGLIRSLEVTHGGNGWHPHTHELWFVERGQCALKIKARIAQLWARACARSGLLDDVECPAFACYSVDVRLNVESGDYLAKQDDSRRWGMAHEVAKATSKQGRAKGVHPHHFLIRNAPGDASLFVEYVKAMKGRRQLFWSHGLKDVCGIGDVTDEQLAEQTEKGAELLALLTPQAWAFVVGNDARSELLDAAEVGGLDAVVSLLASLGVPDSAMPIPPSVEAVA